MLAFNIGVDQTVFALTQLTWLWYGQGIAIVSFVFASLVLLYVLFASQKPGMSAPVWLVVDGLAWIITVPSFLLTVDGIISSTKPVAASLPSQWLNVFAVVGMVGFVTGILSLFAYLAGIGVKEEGDMFDLTTEDFGNYGSQTKTTTTATDDNASDSFHSQSEFSNDGLTQTKTSNNAPETESPSTSTVGGTAGSDETIIGSMNRSFEGDSGSMPANRTVVMKGKRAPRELAWLVQISGVHQGRPYRLGRITEIGRDPSRNQIVVDGVEASSIHAIIRLRQGEFVLQDRGSANGTFVNGQEIVQYKLKDHDLVKVGDVEFAFLQVKADG